jgi:uncharacterized protein (DUF1330 family)
MTRAPRQKCRTGTGWLTAVVLGMAATYALGIHVGSAQAARKAYLLVQADVTNPQQYQEYAKLSPGIVAKYGGRYLARAGRTSTLEGPAAKSRVVVVEFPTFDQARAFYQSAEYIAARKLRAGAATAQFIIVEGVD